MKNFTLFFLVFLPFISSAQQSDTAAGGNSATLYLYYPAEGARGTFKIYMDDSLVWKAQYNSRKEVRIYKEGKTIFWTPPQKQYSVPIDVKFGENYFLHCGLEKGELILMPLLKRVSEYEGSNTFDRIRRDYDSLLARKERRSERIRLDTVVRRSTIYVDIGGQSIAYSLSYDRLFRMQKRVKHSVALGLGIVDYYRLPPGYPRDININFFLPFSYNFLFGRNKSYLEIGIGPTLHFYKYLETGWGPESGNVSCYRVCDYYLSPKIGWRLQPSRGGVFLKVSFSPIISVLYYYSGRKFSKTPEWNEPSSYEFFPDIWPMNIPVAPWVGISAGYTFNFKKKQ